MLLKYQIRIRSLDKTPQFLNTQETWTCILDLTLVGDLDLDSSSDLIYNLEIDQKESVFECYLDCLLNRNMDNKQLRRGIKVRSALSTPEKKSLKNVQFIPGYLNGSCDNLNSNKYFDQDRSLKFLEKHKVVLLGEYNHKMKIFGEERVPLLSD